MLIEHNREKLIEAIRFFALYTNKLGKTKLFKLIYFLDFEHYRETGRSVTGLDYYAWPMGPVPVSLSNELDSPAPDLLKDISFTKTSIYGGTLTMLLVKASGQFDRKYFSKRELRLMESLSEEYKDSTAEQMVEATHLENLPWHQIYNVEGKKQCVIPFELAFRAQERELMQRLTSERQSLTLSLKG